LELDCGGVLLSQFLQQGQVDEMRVTMSGLLVGSLDSALRPRPALFPPGLLSFTPTTTPVWQFLGVKTVSDKALFLRLKVTTLNSF